MQVDCIEKSPGAGGMADPPLKHGTVQILGEGNIHFWDLGRIQWSKSILLLALLEVGLICFWQREIVFTNETSAGRYAMSSHKIGGIFFWLDLLLNDGNKLPAVKKQHC